ncbi:hypothetical protein M0R04_15150, partial [Candidatus Dojkabacteria bacterium]|nr:hypothetical protein [Candidatus Dojkabacteria bacterium]
MTDKDICDKKYADLITKIIAKRVHAVIGVDVQEAISNGLFEYAHNKEKILKRSKDENEFGKLMVKCISRRT